MKTSSRIRLCCILIAFFLIFLPLQAFSQDIFEFIEKNDLANVMNLVENHLELLDVKNEFGWSPIHAAAFFSRDKVMMKLLENGAKINSRDLGGFTPLHLARTMDVARLLIEHKADINAADNQGKTLLHHLIISSNESANIDLIKLLIQKKADMEAKDRDGNTPLHAAISTGNLTVMKMLLESGAKINSTNKFGFSSLHMAFIKTNNSFYENDRCKIVKFLLDNDSDVNQKANGLRTPLHLAVLEPVNHEAVSLLIDGGADLNARNSEGETPLLCSIEAGNVIIAKLLIQRGCNVNLKDNAGNSPLLTALKEGQTAIAEILRSARANE